MYTWSELMFTTSFYQCESSRSVLFCCEICVLNKGREHSILILAALACIGDDICALQGTTVSSWFSIACIANLNPICSLEPFKGKSNSVEATLGNLSGLSRLPDYSVIHWMGFTGVHKNSLFFLLIIVHVHRLLGIFNMQNTFKFLRKNVSYEHVMFRNICSGNFWGCTIVLIPFSFVKFWELWYVV
jgi:hypothetical protein